MQKLCFISLCLGISTVLGIAQAQTSVTTSGGNQNKVPKFSGSFTLSDSAITEVNGNVGIGTTTPGLYPLFVKNSGYWQLINLQNPSTSPAAAMIQFDRSAAAANPAIWNIGYSDFNDAGWPVGFAIIDASSGSSQPRLLINSLGNVGIGTTTPGLYPLFVKNSGYWQLINLQNPSTSPAAAMIQFDRSAATANPAVWNIGYSDFNDAGWPLGFAIIDASSGSSQPRLLINSLGNVGIGTTAPSAKLEIAGSVKLSGAGSSITFPNGDIQSIAWNGTLCGGDYAESVDVSGNRIRYEPGDVLVIDPAQPGKFLKSNEAYSTSVTGVYSTKPGVVGRRQDGVKSDLEVPMAMIGIVPVKVSTENGSIKPGDFLVTAATPGYAMKGTDRERMFGAVVGKALGNLEAGSGVIEAVISLQ